MRVSVSDEFVAAASVVGIGEIEFEFGDEWESYLKEGNLTDLMEKAKTSLASSPTGQCEGKSKGKNGGKPAKGSEHS